MKMSRWDKNLTAKEYSERKALTKAARKRLLRPSCQSCKTKKGLEIHHVDRNWRNNTPKNIMTLCHACHMKWHHSRGHIFPESRRAKPCKVEGCEKTSRRRGYCEMHFERMDRHGTTEPRKKQDTPCKVCGAAYSPGKSRADLCSIHRKVKERYGDPFAKQVGRGGRIPHKTS